MPEREFTKAGILRALQALGAELRALERVYPAHEPPAKTRFFLEELLGSRPRPASG